MTDRPPEEGASDAESLLPTVQSELEPHLLGVIEALADDGGTGSFFTSGAYVQDLLERLRALDGESEMLLLLLDISLIDFQGFEFTDAGRQAVDALLAACASLTPPQVPTERTR